MVSRPPDAAAPDAHDSGQPCSKRPAPRPLMPIAPRASAGGGPGGKRRGERSAASAESAAGPERLPFRQAFVAPPRPLVRPPTLVLGFGLQRRHRRRLAV